MKNEKFKNKMEQFLGQVRISDENVKKLIELGKIKEAEELNKETQKNIGRLTTLLEILESNTFHSAQELHDFLKNRNFFENKIEEIHSIHIAEQADTTEK